MVSLSLIFGVAAVWIVYWVCCVVYNVWFHPLAKFPGPWWAGASSLPEMYFDVVRGGRYFKQIEQMHERYGPIIRIAIDELSIVDPAFYEQMYGGVGARRNLDPRHARLSAAPTSTLSTIDHDLHRVRRAPLATFFSKQAVTQLEPFIRAKVSQLVKKLKSVHAAGSVVSTMDVYGSLTTDIISHYAYGEAFGYLDGDEAVFKNDFLRDTTGLFFAGPFMKHFPLLAQALVALPQWLLSRMNSGMARVTELRRRSAESALRTLQAVDYNKPSVERGRPPTIFQAMADPSVPAQERSLPRLTDEGLVVLIAGLESTARFLTNITCHLLLNPEMLATLREELRTVMPEPEVCPSWNVLETLPYLTAVIQEGLRCETMIIHRNARVLVEPLVYKGAIIPAGTTIGVSPYLLNNHPSVFPDPHAFRPERWLEARECGVNLNRHLASFSKGGRMCAGINLAYAELYLTVAAMVRNFDLQLVDSSLEDVQGYRDFSFGFTKDYKYGIKVRVAGVARD